MSTALDFEQSLVRVRTGEDLDRGDTVFKRSTSGQQVHWTRYRVLSTNRGAAQCESTDGKKRQETIVFNLLWREPPAAADEMPAKPARASVVPLPSARSSAPPPVEPAPCPAPAAPPRAAQIGDEVDAWLALGAGMLDTLRSEVAALEQTSGDLEASLDKIDRHHRERIQELEEQLIAAKRDHHEDRALAATRREDVDRRLVAKRQRLGLLEQLQALK